jgi:predicted DNA-binding protein
MFVERVTISLNPEIIDRIRKHCKSTGRTVSGLINNLFYKYLEEEIQEEEHNVSKN